MGIVKGIQCRRQYGMSLVEVLVALLVLGIGVMGYAALQLRAVRMTEDTYARSQAMSIAQDAIERIRANSHALERYTGADWQADPAEPAVTCTFTNQAPAAAASCSAEQLAAVDIYELHNTVRSSLPSGSIAVEACEQLACVIVAWNGTDASACDESDVDDNDRGDAAHCVTVHFQ